MKASRILRFRPERAITTTTIPAPAIDKPGTFLGSEYRSSRIVGTRPATQTGHLPANSIQREEGILEIFRENHLAQAWFRAARHE